MQKAFCSEIKDCAEEEFPVFFIHDPKSEVPLKAVAKSFIISVLGREQVREE